MNKLEQAARQALTWMEWYDFDTRLPEPDFDVAITALREALAEQAEQEPVAWMEDSIELYVSEKPSSTYTIPLYAAPVRTKDLTDDYYELIYAVGSKFPNESRHETALRYIRQAEQGDNQARAVIAADREKNK